MKLSKWHKKTEIQRRERTPMSNLVSLDLLEDELSAVVQAGRYKSKRELIGHALEVLLMANPHLRLKTAVELYRREKATLSRGAEIAGLEFEAFKEQLAEKNVPILVDETPEEIRASAERIHKL